MLTNIPNAFDSLTNLTDSYVIELNHSWQVINYF